ncbi:MAG TPA: tetratricopeptide repeat protein [Novosphingobium sp.]|nr:tetratricopeptide repeat protein [Novosphingobium sp.]
MAQQQMAAGDLAGATITINKAIREQDDVADLYVLKARIAAAANRPGEVFQAYTLASDLEPNNVDALRGLAQIAFQIGRNDDAGKAVTRLLAQSPADPTGRLVKGLLDLGRCRAQEALDIAARILSDNPVDEGGLVLRTRALFALGREQEARKVLDDATSRLGATFGLLLTRIDIDRTRADVSALRADYVAVRKLQPANADLALQQVNFLYKTGDMAGARAAGAMLLRARGVQGDDLDRLTRIWREYDPSPLAAADLAQLAARGSRPARVLAAQHYLEVGQAAPVPGLLAGLQGSDVAGMLARAQLAAGHRSEAEAAARAVLEEDKTQCDALLALAGVHLAAGRREEASARANDAAAECPRLWVAYVVMADANSASVPQLARVTGAALDADPQNGSLAVALSRRWLARGQPDRALAVARRITRSAPALVSGWTLLQSLCGRGADASCAADAARGLGQARRRYTLDTLPGQLPPLGGRPISCRDAAVSGAAPEPGEGDGDGSIRGTPAAS